MDTDYRAALVGQLDPTLKKPALPGGDPGMQSTMPIGGTAELPASPGQPAAPGPLSPEAAPAPARDFGRLGGYNADKFNANKDDAKYQMGGVLSTFDPRQGITPEVLAGLNKLGYGTFSGSGDKLSLSGLTDVGRSKGLVGDYKDADFIGAYKSGNGKWGYADPAYEAQHPEPSAGGGGQFAGSSVNPMLQSNAGDNIQNALASLQQPGLLQQLIAQLQGGQ